MHAEPRLRRSALLTAGALAAAAAVVIGTLMIPPIVGLADNGDFDRIGLPAGLRPMSLRPEDRFNGWMQPRFAYAPRTSEASALRSSESLLVEAAVATSEWVSRAPAFDIRFLGAVHAVLLLAALGLLVSAAGALSAGAQAAAAALAVFFFTDVGYLAPLQSLYTQSASLLFLLLTAGIAAQALARGRLGGLWLPAYFLGAALFVCSKPQESIQAVLLAPLGVRLAWGASGRSRVVAVFLAAALIALGWRFYRSAQASSGWVTRYNVLFMELLPSSPDPRRDLEELGLDPGLARHSGVSAWVPESPARFPEVRAHLDPRSGKTSPRMLFLRHPERLLPVLGKYLNVSYALQPRDLGHFARESGAPALARARGAWSSLRRHLSGVPWLVVFLGGTLAAAAWSRFRAGPRGRLACESLAVLVAMASGAFLVAALGDAGIEPPRHLFAFQAMCDLILIADVVWIVQALVSRRTASARAAI
jgi:hypothetical protein